MRIKTGHLMVDPRTLGAMFDPESALDGDGIVPDSSSKPTNDAERSPKIFMGVNGPGELHYQTPQIEVARSAYDGIPDGTIVTRGPMQLNSWTNPLA